MSNFHDGDLHDHQLGKEMRLWKGRIADRRGREFSELVAERLTELGWQTQTEVAVTKILRKGFDRDYGDVDVLAWHVSGRVLLIECKDVQYRKTYGEVAEQLSGLWNYSGRSAIFEAMKVLLGEEE